jgi:RNA polymerase sigma-70 factor (ECF subfamily)
MIESDSTDEAISRVLAGDRDAFRMIVRENSLMLRSYLGSQLHHASDVDDLAQEVFIAAFRRLNQFDRRGDFRAWLRGIARKQLLHHFRTIGRRNAAVAKFRMEVFGTIEQELESAIAATDNQLIEALLRCISQLPQRMRHVVRSGLDGIKAAALADEMETTIGAIYNIHYRANSLLRECVKSESK